MKITLLLFISVFTVLAEDKKAAKDWGPVLQGPHELRVEDSIGDEGVKITTSFYKLDKFTCMERIVQNKDATIRGRIIWFYKDNKLYKSISYKGFSTPWCTEVYSDNHKVLPSGEILVTQSYDPSGNILAGKLCSKDGEFLHYVGKNGDKITEEQASAMGNEIGYYLFGKKMKKQENTDQPATGSASKPESSSQ